MKQSISGKVLFGLVWVTLLLAQAGFSQFETSTVVGTVWDQQGAIVPAAIITLRNIHTGITSTTTTDGSGNYEFFNVKVGVYRVTASMSGFRDARADNVNVVVNTRQRVEFRLELAPVGATVEVTEAAATPVEADTSDRGQVIASKQTTELPLNGRNYADLTMLGVGVTRSSMIAAIDAVYDINGLGAFLNGFQLDGVDNTAYQTAYRGWSVQVTQVTPDAVAEFKVQFNNMSAEYGSVGGGTINASLKSGTNQFHGSAWEFVRNTNLNAVGFFKPVQNQKPTLQRNQFGFTFGGPIKKNKTFFFMDYEGFRQITRGLAFASIPTLPQRQGIMGTPIKNPFTGETYSDGVIPQSQITPFARKVLVDLPAPTRPGIANNYDTLPRNKRYNDKEDVKIDHLFNSKVTSFVRLSQRKENWRDPGQLPFPSGVGNITYTLNQQLAAAVTYTPTPRSLLEFRLGVSRSLANTKPLGLGSGNMLELYGIPGLPEDPQFSGGLNSQVISGFSGLGRGSTSPQFQNFFLYDPRINYSLSVNRHSVKMGYEYEPINTEVLDINAAYGLDTYAGRFSQPPGGTGNAAIYNLADFLFGARSQYQLATYFVGNHRNKRHFAYLQDNFKFSPKLTLNLGIRYEFATPTYERDNKYSNYDPATNSVILARDGSLEDRALVKPDYNNFAPRVGFAYSLDRRTVIRAGYGISYIHFWRQGSRNTLISNPPQYLNYSKNQIPSDPDFRPTQAGYPANFLDPKKIDTRLVLMRYVPRDVRSSYVQSWFFSIQREVIPNTLVDIAYVGNHALKLEYFGDFNQARPNGPGENLTLDQRRPLQNFGGIFTSFHGGFSTYNALQVKLERRYSAGLYLLNSFTWAKTLASTALGLEGFNGNEGGPQDIYNLAAEKGQSAFDRTLNNVTSVVWEVPVGKGRRYLSGAQPLANAFLGGWQVSLINFMTSGEPMTLRYSPAAAFNVGGNMRPNLIGDPKTPKAQRTITNYLNRDTVVIPTDPSRPFGNAGKGIVASHAFYQVDAALTKEFALPREGLRLQLRVEPFNLLNKPNFRAAGINRTFANFGVISGAYDARQIQMALKLHW